MYKKEKKILYVSIMVFVVFAAAWFFALSMVVSEYKLYKEYSFVLEQENAKLSGAQTLAKLLRETEEERDRIARMYVSETRLADFLDEVNQISLLTGSDIDLISLDQEDDKLEMKYKIVGNFNDVVSTVKAIENMQYYLVLNDISLKKVRTNTLDSGLVEIIWEGNITVSLESFVKQG